MSQSFESLMHGESEGGREGDPYSERQSSDDIQESTATITTTTETTNAGDGGGGGGGGEEARDGDEDDFTDENNFESNLRRRKGKILSCAKETIENGQYKTKYIT